LGIYISEMRKCLLLKNSLDLLYQIMENILYILLVVHGTMRHVMGLD
jgi:hypothetical protein